MKKKIISVLLCISMILTSVSFAYAEPITLKVNGLLNDFISQPVIENDVLLLDGRELSQIIGADSKWDSNEKTLTIIKGTRIAVYKLDNTAYSFNGKTKYLKTKVTQSKDSLLLPIRAVCEDFGAKVSWDSGNQLLQINLDDNLITFLNTNEVIDKSTQVITFDEALNMAVQINSTIKTLNENIDYMEKNRKAMLNDYNKYSISGMDASALTLNRGMNTIDETLSNIPQNEEMIKKATEYMLVSTLNRIKNYHIDIALLKETIALQSENLKNITLRQSVGMASVSEVNSAKLDLEKSKSNLQNLDIGLRSQKSALNRLLGLPSGQKVYVSYVPKMSALSITDIESYAISKTEDDPSIIIKKRELEAAEFTMNTSISMIQNWDNPDKNDADKAKSSVDLSTASRALNDAKEDMKESIRSIYSNIKQVEESQKSLRIDLQKAKDTYNNAKVSFDAGMITSFEIKQAKLAILQVEGELIRNVYSYDNLMFTLNNPFLLAKDSGSNSAASPNSAAASN